ncbi:MAG: endopeptidase La, partial [Clostridia bacterium]|nr:endopeptidase La [Clostridia bacterium]
TEVGGDVLKIEASVMDGSGKLELTGTLGEVMKESARIALSYLRAHSDEVKRDGDFYKTHDIHIHVPEGAVPKDGPSAGVTMTTALYSILTGKRVRCDTAMTGEVTLTGRVLAIGGLREKVTAAYNAGIKRIIIPQTNVADLEKIDPEVRSEITFIPCTRVDEVLKNAIREDLSSHKPVRKDDEKPERIKVIRSVSDGAERRRGLSEK